jgi:hypothetical protein
LKEDNRNLMGMLRETKEFKDFAGYVDDSGGNVRLATAQNTHNTHNTHNNVGGGEDGWVPD